MNTHQFYQQKNIRKKLKIIWAEQVNLVKYDRICTPCLLHSAIRQTIPIYKNNTFITICQHHLSRHAHYLRIITRFYPHCYFSIYCYCLCILVWPMWKLCSRLSFSNVSRTFQIKVLDKNLVHALYYQPLHFWQISARWTF